MNPLQEQCLAVAQEHYDADEIIQGKFRVDGKGCNIGCVAETGNNPHRVWLEKMDLPKSVEWLPRLGDGLFEGLPNGEAKEFVLDFHYAVASKERSIKEWDRIRREFLIFTLRETLKNETTWRKEDPEDRYTTQVVQAVNGSIDYLQGKKDRESAESAAESARYAAESARFVAHSVALSARSVVRYAAEAARYAAEAARSVVRYAALSARYAARSVVRYAARYAAEAARYAAESARYAAEAAAVYQRMSAKLLQLLRTT